jgi:hypothetical protein
VAGEDRSRLVAKDLPMVSEAPPSAPVGLRATRTKLGFGRRGPEVGLWEVAPKGSPRSRIAQHRGSLRERLILTPMPGETVYPSSCESRFAQYWPVTVPVRELPISERSPARSCMEGTGIWPVSTPCVSRVPDSQQRRKSYSFESGRRMFHQTDSDQKRPALGEK